MTIVFISNSSVFLFQISLISLNNLLMLFPTFDTLLFYYFKYLFYILVLEFQYLCFCRSDSAICCFCWLFTLTMAHFLMVCHFKCEFVFLGTLSVGIIWILGLEYFCQRRFGSVSAWLLIRQKTRSYILVWDIYILYIYIFIYLYILLVLCLWGTLTSTVFRNRRFNLCPKVLAF